MAVISRPLARPINPVIARQITGSAGNSPSYNTVVTDASATPTTTALTLPGGYNAFRVWTGETAVTEGEFNLYVRLNGGSAKTINTTRWQGRVIAATAGDSIALGTTNGRTVYVAPVIAPASLTAPTATSGTANCDQAGPPLWSPSAPHVTLADFHQTINLAASDATKRVIFISEYTGSTWTPPRWYWLPASGSINVLCTYKQVAIANYAGVAVSVTAPTGAIIGGTSASMSLPIPAFTTTIDVTDAATLQAAMASANASGGYVNIRCAPGTYPLTIPVDRNTFAANHTVGGRFGMEGIFITGLTGNRADVVITGNGSGTNGNWDLNHSSAVNQYAGYAGLKDVTFDFAGIDATFAATSGNWLVQNCNFTGASSSSKDLFAFACNANRAISIDILESNASTAGSDCWNGSGDTTTNAASRARLINCSGSVAGPNVNDQIVTSHAGLPYEVYGGTYSDANLNVVANDSGTTNGYFFFSTFTPGARNCGIVNGINLFGCTITQTSGSGTLYPGDQGSNNGYHLFNHGTINGYRSSASAVPTAGSVITGNLYSPVGTTRVYFPSIGNSPAFRRNIAIGTTQADILRVANYASGSTNAIIATSNTFVATTGGVTINDATLPCTFTNNAITSTSGTQITAGGATTTGNYNTARSKNASYTNGANDTIGSNAAIDATSYIPTASGNCDNNGDPNIGFAGGTDAFGWVWNYKTSTPPRGARSRPAVYSGADLYADVWA